MDNVGRVTKEGWDLKALSSNRIPTENVKKTKAKSGEAVLPGDTKVSVKRSKTLTFGIELRSLKTVKEKLESKYKIQPTKELYDSITHLDQTIFHITPLHKN